MYIYMNLFIDTRVDSWNPFGGALGVPKGVHRWGPGGAL